ncbi:MAG: DNA topoisomerase [Phycisphaerae bacterium]
MAKRKVKPVARDDLPAAGTGDAEEPSSRARSLVVVESPAKAKTINRYLGRDYLVKASMGHVRDLPKGELGVDVANGFKPTYEPLPDRRKVLTELRKLARSAPEVFLATDLDREGEAIAWHLAESLGVPAERIRRVLFNEITKAAIHEAFANPRNIDMHKVDAQQARRILDRIVGFNVSELLWRKVARGLSAGRVQSVAVRLIVDRERQIDAFVPEEYWKIAAIFTTDLARAGDLSAQWLAFITRVDEKGNQPTRDAQAELLAKLGAFRAELVSWQGRKFEADSAAVPLEIAKALGLVIDKEIVSEDAQAKGPARKRFGVVGHLNYKGDGAPAVPPFSIRNVNQRDARTNPLAPFTTAALQQAASVQLRFSASRTMRIAQQLYEGIDVPGEGTVGLITYMRTDSTHLSNEAVAQVRSLIQREFGPPYLPAKPNTFASGERAQEAHEAIRPTSADRRPRELISALTDEQYKLYDLIWKRFVGCQMTPAVWKVTEADIVAAVPAGEAVFKAMGRQLAFDGFLRVAGMPRTGDQMLPPLAAGQAVSPLAIDPTQHFTQAPPRYTEASLVKALEADGIGRPSTYASIIQTIQDRQYVQLVERSFRPTDLGVVVTDKLVKHFPKIFDVHFTAHMEEELDLVEDNKAQWTKVLDEFYGPFDESLKRAADEMVHAKAETQPSDYKCETCGKPMIYRFSKNGRYLACTGYPECKTTYPVDREGKRIEKQLVDVACPKCGSAMQLRRGRFGPFLSCSKYPDCDGILRLDRKGILKLPTSPPLVVDMPCPKCGGGLNLRRSRRGHWLACSKFPKCRARVPWADVPEDKQREYTRLLEQHEQANPVPTLHRMDGTQITGGFNPVTGETIERPIGESAGRTVGEPAERPNEGPTLASAGSAGQRTSRSTTKSLSE